MRELSTFATGRLTDRRGRRIIEALAYLQPEYPDKEQRGHIDHLVDLIEKAQQPDGYLNVHFVVNEPEKRWSNLRDLHELYNGELRREARARAALTASSPQAAT